MTPQEKAEELVDKYRVTLIMSDTEASEEILCTTIAKQCALVAVDEILKILPTNEYLEDLGKYIENRERVYYKEVKQEIEKL